MAEAGKLVPLVDQRRFTLETAMDAHALVESRRWIRLWWMLRSSRVRQAHHFR
jgi:hypothetical protein